MVQQNERAKKKGRFKITCCYLWDFLLSCFYLQDWWRDKVCQEGHRQGRWERAFVQRIPGTGYRLQLAGQRRCMGFVIKFVPPSLNMPICAETGPETFPTNKNLFSEFFCMSLILSCRHITSTKCVQGMQKGVCFWWKVLFDRGSPLKRTVPIWIRTIKTLRGRGWEIGLLAPQLHTPLVSMLQTTQ